MRVQSPSTDDRANDAPSDAAGAFSRLTVDPVSQAPIDEETSAYVFASGAAFMTLVRNTDRYRKHLAERSHLSVIELQALRRISEGDVVTPKDVAATLELTTGAVTALIDRLDVAGLATRLPHPHDRRSVRLTLTEEGQARMSKVFEHFQSVVLDAIRDLPREEVIASTRMLERLGERFGNAAYED